MKEGMMSRALGRKDLLLYIAQGFSRGIMLLISYNYVGKNGKRLKQTVRYSLKNTDGSDI